MAPPFEHGKQKCEPAADDTLRHPPRDSGRRRPDKSLDLDDKWPPPLEHGHRYAARHTATAVPEQQGARVHQAAEPHLGHLEQPELACGTVAVLGSRKQAEGLVPVAVERQHRVDKVLERARPGEPAVLGDVADQQRGDSQRLRVAHEAARALAHLAR